MLLLISATGLKVVKILAQQETLEDSGYIFPPSYQDLGNALVYDCKGRSWACVNPESYFQCRDNMNWNSSHKKRYECYTVSVYATDLDCESIQLFNTESLAKTDFCQF